MNAKRDSVAALVAITLLSACAAIQPAGTAQAGLKNEVASFLQGYLVAIDRRDSVAIRGAFIADDRFVWIEDGRARYRHVGDVLSGLASFPAGSPIRTELFDLSVAPVGAAGAHAWASFKTTVGEGSQAFAFQGAISFVLERDGTRWRIVSGHTSSPGRR
jgi:SnoaL-like domain